MAMLADGSAHYGNTSNDDDAFVTAGNMRQHLQFLLDSKEKQLQLAGALGQRVLAQQMELEERIRQFQELGARKGEDTDLSAEMSLKYRELSNTLKSWEEENMQLSSAFGGNPQTNGLRASPKMEHAELSQEPPSHGTSAASQSRRAKNAAHRANDVEFAFEIGSNLLTEVRRLQSILGERDKAIQEMKEEKDDLERALEGLRSALKAQEQTADRFKEDNWNLEITLQEIRSRLHEAEMSTQSSRTTPDESQVAQTMSTIAQFHALSRIHPSYDELAKLLKSFERFDLAARLTVGGFCANGGYADVYDGWLIPEDGASTTNGKDNASVAQEGMCTQMKVAIKQFRVFRSADVNFAKEFVRELRLWANLNHPNVLPLLGFTLVDKSPSLVSEWMDNGTMLNYVISHPQTSAVTMAEGIADGLAFLHANSVIHADLKSDNVLVDRDGRPVLCDFGISRVVIESKTMTGTTSLKGNIRWMAVELLHPHAHAGDAAKHQFHTRESDVWAYGMVVNEILSLNVPFHDKIYDGQVIMAIASGERPSKPVTCKDPYLERLWSMCVSCWAVDPKNRPSMVEICAKLKALPDEHATPAETPKSTENSRRLPNFARFETFGALFEYARSSQRTANEDKPRSRITKVLSVFRSCVGHNSYA